LNIVEGDVFKDALPAGHDALIVANTAHVFSASHNIELMRKMRAGVQPGARLLLVDLWTDPSHTQPGQAALISGEFLVISGEGQAYSEQEADLKRVEAIGIDEIILYFNFGNRRDAFVREQMHRFMDDIAPAFGGASGEKAAAVE
jgi:O-methyltransferase domain